MDKVNAPVVAAIAEVAISADGAKLLVNFLMADGTDEWRSIDYEKVAHLAVTLVNAAQYAAARRPKLTPGGNPMPEKVSGISPHSAEVALSPEGSVILRLILDAGGAASAEYRLGPKLAGIVGQGLSQAAHEAGTGTPSQKH